MREGTVSFMNDKHKHVACSYLVDTLIGGDNEEEDEEQGEKEALY